MNNNLVQNLAALKKLPNTWNVLPFEEAIEDSSSGNVKTLKSDFLSEGKFLIIDQGQEKIAGYTNNRDILVKSPPPYIIFGDHTRIFKFIEVPFAMGADGTKVLKSKDETILNEKYLYYFFLTLNIPNTGYNRHYKYLKGTKIPLPSLPEQQKIASVLDAADSLRQKDQQLIEKYTALSQSLFLEIFGDPVVNPMGFDRKTIRDLVSDVKYGTSSKAEDDGEYPYLRMNNITYQGYMDFENLKYINVTDKDKEKYVVKAGDLLFNRTNSKELVGKTGLYNKNTEMIIAGYPNKS